MLALLAVIDVGLVDLIPANKIDRMTHLLTDFSKIVGKLDERGASFISVTQSFNIATSMGPFTLYLLLSFAQFEHDIKTGIANAETRSRGKPSRKA